MWILWLPHPRPWCATQVTQVLRNTLCKTVPSFLITTCFHQTPHTLKPRPQIDRLPRGCAELHRPTFLPSLPGATHRAGPANNKSREFWNGSVTMANQRLTLTLARDMPLRTIDHMSSNIC